MANLLWKTKQRNNKKKWDSNDTETITGRGMSLSRITIDRFLQENQSNRFFGDHYYFQDWDFERFIEMICFVVFEIVFVAISLMAALQSFWPRP
jgi:hypothetical protein